MDSINEYDFICVGAGPAGLTLVYCLGKLGYKCLLIDEHDSVGGCHRVLRVNGLFTEHAPRIYSSSYKNFQMLLKDMNLDFDKVFTPYKFSLVSIGGKGLSHFSASELLAFVKPFLTAFILDSNYGKTVSMQTFMTDNNFSFETQDYVDRLCRLTDGAGADRYTLFKFIQLINQQALYKIYQPTEPNDMGLFQSWADQITETGNVQILLNSKVKRLVNNNFGRISSLTLEIHQDSQAVREIEVHAKNFVLAIPPHAMIQILKASPSVSHAFGPLNQVSTWSTNNQYIHDIGLMFHWDRFLDLPDIHGFPASDWGIAFIKLTDYMNFNDSRSHTVITTCITRIDVPSTRTGKTANQSSRDELREEVYYQLLSAYPNLPKPTTEIISPTVRREGNQWVDTDTAYVQTPENKFLPSQSPIFSNLFTLGTHNGTSIYQFTSLESATTSAISLLHELHPESQQRYPIQYMWTLSNLLVRIIYVVIIVIIFFYMIKHTDLWTAIKSQINLGTNQLKQLFSQSL